ncbi:MAG: GNAT family N-acetyltransferase [Acidimicrobiia bacterium]
MTETLRRAVPDDLERLLTLVEAFYVMDGHDYDEQRVGRALIPLLADDRRGQVWVLSDETTGHVSGYAVVTWSWSLESGGMDAILDEIFVEYRNHGAGGRLLRHSLASAARAGATRMYLETAAHNEMVRRFYRRNGFVPDDSIWMSADLEPADQPACSSE